MESGRAQRKKLYVSHKWKLKSKAFLRNKSCVDCGKVARCTDHSQGHSGDWASRFWDERLWEARCWSCHSSKTARTEQGRGVGGRGFGAGGEGGDALNRTQPHENAICTLSKIDKGIKPAGPAKTVAERLLAKRRKSGVSE